MIKNNQPCLTDFGLAKDFTNLDESASHGETAPGTPRYRAPEVASKQERGRAADVFSMGCVYFEMLIVSQGKSVKEYAAERGKMAYRLCLPAVEAWLNKIETGKLNDLLKDEICDMMNKDPQNRPTAQDVLNHFKRESALFCAEHQ